MQRNSVSLLTLHGLVSSKWEALEGGPLYQLLEPNPIGNVSALNWRKSRAQSFMDKGMPRCLVFITFPSVEIVNSASEVTFSFLSPFIAIGKWLLSSPSASLKHVHINTHHCVKTALKARTTGKAKTTWEKKCIPVTIMVYECKSSREVTSSAVVFRSVSTRSMGTSHVCYWIS